VLGCRLGREALMHALDMLNTTALWVVALSLAVLAGARFGGRQ